MTWSTVVTVLDIGVNTWRNLFRFRFRNYNLSLQNRCDKVMHLLSYVFAFMNCLFIQRATRCSLSLLPATFESAHEPRGQHSQWQPAWLPMRVLPVHFIGNNEQVGRSCNSISPRSFATNTECHLSLPNDPCRSCHVVLKISTPMNRFHSIWLSLPTGLHQICFM